MFDFHGSAVVLVGVEERATRRRGVLPTPPVPVCCEDDTAGSAADPSSVLPFVRSPSRQLEFRIPTSYSPRFVRVQTPSRSRPRLAARFVGRPLWVYHGDADDVVPVELSREMVAAIHAAGAGDELRYTEFPGVGHVSWDRVYADPEVARFLFGDGRGHPP